MKKWLRAALACLIVLCILMVPVKSRADVGNFAGDSDYGGGDSDDGWDGGGDSDFDDDYDGGGGGSGGFAWIIGVVIVAVAIISDVTSKRRSGKNRPARPMAPQDPNIVLASLKQRDPKFSEQAFLERVNNMYVQMQNAWTEKKWEPLRAMFTDALYNQLKRQLDEYVNHHQTNHVDRIAVLNSFITSCREDETNDIVTVQLETRIVDYVTDDATGQVISGSNTREKFMTYEWTMIRRRGVLTQSTPVTKVLSCPSCGAPLDINQSGQCAYCGSIITSGEYDWVVSQMRCISQRTAG